MALQRSRLQGSVRRFRPSPVKDKDTLEVLGRVEAQLTEVYNHALESDRALRGYDNEPGVVARVVSLQGQVATLTDTVTKDHKTLEEVARYQKEFPSLTWIAKYQTSKFLGYIGGVVLLGLAAPLVGINLLRLLLHSLQVPDPLIEFYLGK